VDPSFCSFQDFDLVSLSLFVVTSRTELSQSCGEEFQTESDLNHRDLSERNSELQRAIMTELCSFLLMIKMPASPLRFTLISSSSSGGEFTEPG
jgi:hypothetical protein